MHVTKDNLSDTSIKLNVSAEPEELRKIKDSVVARLGKEVRVPGFRAGKAPRVLLEKQLDTTRLQSEFLDAAINELYVQAAQQQKLRPVASPNISITKFVPFDTLEFTAEVEVVGDVTLPDYKRIRVEKITPEVTTKDINDVIERLKVRESTKKEVKRAAHNDDEVLIDFSGIDAKTNDPVNGADGKDYPLLLGSNAFIPGFEPALIGLKSGEEKTFSVTFPKDYGVAALQSRKVSFTVKVKKVQAVTLPKLDDALARKVGPFKTIKELKADIKKQLLSERQTEAARDYENRLINTIGEQTKVAIPEALVSDQIDKMERDERQNLTYRGQTWEEHLAGEGLTEEQHHEQQRPTAELNVRIGLALAEIAEKESVTVSREELEARLAQLKGEYTDKEMQAELDKPENRQDILNRLITEKTLDILLSYSARPLPKA
jgi:trigger factor